MENATNVRNEEKLLKKLESPIKLFTGIKKAVRPFEVIPLLMLAGAIRFFHLGTHSLWYDEIFTVWDSAQPLSQIHRTILASPPLYDYIIHFFYVIFGKSDFWLRFPSAFFGTVTIFIAYRMIFKVLGREAAFWTTLIWAVFPFHVVYSQELRMYSLLVLESLVASYAWSMALRRDDQTDWIVFGIASLLGLYTHNWYLFLFASQALGFGIRCVVEKRISWGGLTVFASVALFYLPWIPLMKSQAAQDTFNNYLAAYAAPTLYHIQVTIEAFAGIRNPSGQSWITAWPFAKFILGPSMIVLLGMGLYQAESKKDLWWTFIFSFLLPLATGLLVSIFLKPIYHGSRYTILVLPAFFLTIAHAFKAKNIRWQQTARILAAVWVLLLIKPIANYLIDYEKAPWKKSDAWINENAGEKDAVITAEMSEMNQLCLDYYLRPDIQKVSSFEESKEFSRLFLPVERSRSNEVIRALPAAWRATSFYDGNKLIVLVLSKKNGT